MGKGSLKRAVNEKLEEGPGRYPRTGLVVSLQTKGGEPLSATVTRSFSNEACVKLSRPSPESSLRKGGQVLVKHWNEQAVSYYWNAEIVKVFGDQNEDVALSLSGEGMTVQRRKSFRADLSIPLSLTVIDAAESDINGETIEAETLNFSIGGLKLETTLPLQIGDRLEVTLLKQIDAVGWVVRSESVGRKAKNLRAIAVEFLQIDEAAQYQIVELLAAEAGCRQLAKMCG
jgi:c-di-GMP-binding flagellar brake protein YcgR